MSTYAAYPFTNGQAVACGGRAPLGKGQDTAGVRGGPAAGSAAGMMVLGSSALPGAELVGSPGRPVCGELHSVIWHGISSFSMPLAASGRDKPRGRCAMRRAAKFIFGRKKAAKPTSIRFCGLLQPAYSIIPCPIKRAKNQMNNLCFKGKSVYIPPYGRIKTNPKAYCS